jgi:hypothetical protein
MAPITDSIKPFQKYYGNYSEVITATTASASFSIAGYIHASKSLYPMERIIGPAKSPIKP